MRGDKGNCQIVENGGLFFKTKFDTIINCQNRINVLTNLGAFKETTLVFKCKECNMFHLGSPKEKEKYAKK